MLKFFTAAEEERIVKAIQEAEQRTSGEVRVHIESKSKGNVMDDALRIFHRTGMHKTKVRNGVLILLAPSEKAFAILGDEGINKVVGENFWQEEREVLEHHFRQGEFCEGIVTVIGQIGEKLHTHFPVESDDINELPDEVSYD